MMGDKGFSADVWQWWDGFHAEAYEWNRVPDFLPIRIESQFGWFEWN